jgi:hypothetical protein
MARHVPIVATLLIVQGALECALGALYVVIGPLTPRYMARAGRYHAPADMPRDLDAIVMAATVAVGFLALAFGILKIVAGVRNRRYRGRGLGLVALASGVLTSGTCYCAPTALALLIYGLVVYLNPDAVAAFRTPGPP